MACNKPIQAWQRAEGETLWFRKPKGEIFRELLVDCTRCLGCRKRYKQEWTARVLLENHLQEHALFATLTYNPENIPDDWGLPYRDIQLYHKRIGKRFGKAPRFVNVGEYGGKKNRPHWHEIMWGINPGDLEEAGKGSRGDPIYKSQILEDLWRNGNVRLGEVNPTTAAYVVGYHLKDTNSKSLGAYDYQDPVSGEWFTRDNPKMRTSRNPGIGADFYEKFKGDMYPKGSVHHQGKRLVAGRYFLNKLKESDPDMHAKIVADREELINSPAYQAEHTEARMATKERILEHEQAKHRLDKGPDIGPEDAEFWSRTHIPPIAQTIANMQGRGATRDPNLSGLVRGWNPR